MKRLTLFTVMLCTSPTLLADSARGKTLHDEACTKCHDSSVYTREDRFIKDREALAKQVRRCQLSTGAGWSDADASDVVDYLNTSFYKFE